MRMCNAIHGLHVWTLSARKSTVLRLSPFFSAQTSMGSSAGTGSITPRRTPWSITFLQTVFTNKSEVYSLNKSNIKRKRPYECLPYDYVKVVK